uniref:Uncharacterized protein n=1 Tax=Tetradesmus obliquus TaxID=3088 RepID=A0A383WHI2_TETOB|eukprot:jgi/Sobl393_1/8281/SZX76918.1
MVNDAAGNVGGSFRFQLLALGGAALGMDMSQLVQATCGVDPKAMLILAAAHPEAFTTLIDCYMHSPVLQAADMIAATQGLAHAAVAVLGSVARPTGLLDNTAAVAGLASATTSFAKRAAQLTLAAFPLRRQAAAVAPAGGARRAERAAAYFPAALVTITSVLQNSFARRLLSAYQHGAVTGSDSSSSSSSSGSQAAASTVLLCVVAARSMVKLADAMQAAGPQLLFRDSCQMIWLHSLQLHAINAM